MVPTRGLASISPTHIERIRKMYSVAPISGLFNDHDLMSFDEKGNTTLRFTPKKEHCHTMMALHGSGYFKCLDDAAFFAAQALSQYCSKLAQCCAE